MSSVAGSCHCGAVSFEACFADETIQTIKCNCSICRKTRFWMTVVPEDHFSLKTGADAVNSYRFGRRVIEHVSCQVCSVKIFGKTEINGVPSVAVSVPCLDLAPETLADLPVQFVDGLLDKPTEKPKITSYL